MSDIISLEEALGSKANRVIEGIKTGKVFIYPTDTVYGLGCNALIENSVIKIREIKKSNQLFSVIAPSKKWITENFVMNFPEYLDKLPGPYTLILGMKKQIVPVIVSEGTLGVRIPDHPFTKIIQASGMPFITTSCNLHGQAAITKISGTPKRILSKIDIAIDGGVLKSPASQVIDMTKKRPVVLRK